MSTLVELPSAAHAGNVAINPVNVVAMFIEAGGQFDGSVRIEQSSGRQSHVIGTLVGTSNAMFPPLLMSVLPSATSVGAFVLINPEWVDNVDVPDQVAPFTPVITTVSGQRYMIADTLANVIAALNAATAGQPNQSGGAVSYTPTFTSSGLGVITALGSWRALRVGTKVHVVGAFEFTPAVAGVLETIRFTLHPSMPPTPAPFVTGLELTGIGSANNQGADLVRGTVGASTAEVEVTAAAVVGVAVAFSYDTP